MKNLTKAYHIKHGRSTPYYPQGNGQAEATNRVILKILKKMKHEYGGKWSAYLADVLWACRSSLKTATRFSPFSLVYGLEAISPVELVIPTPRVVLEEICESAFSLALRPKNPGPDSCSLVDWALIHRS